MNKIKNNLYFFYVVWVLEIWESIKKWETKLKIYIYNFNIFLKLNFTYINFKHLYKFEALFFFYWKKQNSTTLLIWKYNKNNDIVGWYQLESGTNACSV